MLLIVLSTLAVLIVLSLAFYAGRLLFLLKRQSQQQQERRQARIDNITESIQTIALAISQQQCDLSEGTIRLCVLLETLPLDPAPNFAARYPSLHQLYAQIKYMPTHEERQKQARNERLKMDMIRAELEVQLETAILKETAELRHFSV